MNAPLALAAALLLAAPARAAQTPWEGIRQIFEQVSALVAEQSLQDAATAAETDRKIQKLQPKTLAWGADGVPVLAAIAGDGKRPAQVRLWALTFAAMTRDPAAFPILERTLLDAAEAPALRAAAAEYLASLGVGRKTTRDSLGQALEQEKLPLSVFRSVLIGLSDVGCANPEALERWAESFGPRPEGPEAEMVRRLIAILGKSPPLSATRALLRLFDYYRQGSREREAILETLALKKEALMTFPEEAAASIRAAAAEEFHADRSALAAIRLVTMLRDPKASSLLLTFLRHPDAAVVVAAADALAELRCEEAREPLQKLLKRIHEDPRFAPLPGRPDPAKAAYQIRSALGKLCPAE